MSRFCPHCGGAIGPAGDDAPHLFSWHTVTWADGFRLTRIFSNIKRGLLVIELEWQGRLRRVRLTKTKTEAGDSERLS
jgi:hypothetical protein